MPSITDSEVVLIIGATSGIGRALALAIHQLPSKPTVIVGGRRTERLEEIVKNEGTGEGRLRHAQVDVGASRAVLAAFTSDILSTYPDLDTVIFSAGVQYQIDFTDPERINLDEATTEFNVNYVAILTLTTLFLPHLLKLGSEGRPTFIAPITSGLAMVPSPLVPNYCATKAAVHSLCMSLRAQLQDKNVHIMEIIPPLVESELHDKQGTTERLSKFWMPLDDYTKETMKGLERGDFQVMPAALNETWEKHEKGKAERCLQMWEQLKSR